MPLTITRLSTSRLTSAAALAASALLLSACGGGDPSPGGGPGGGGPGGAGPDDAATSQSVFQFDETRVADSDDEELFASSDEEVVVTLSDELRGVLPEGTDVAVDHFTLNATAFSTGICRLDVNVAYTDGGREFLQQADFGDSQPETVLKGLSYPINSENAIERGGLVDAPPSDDEVETNAQYITSDFSHATYVEECSDDGDDEHTKLTFLYSSGPESQVDSGGGGSQFAGVDIAVVPGSQSGEGGATILIDGRTEANLTANGQWAPADG